MSEGGRVAEGVVVVHYWKSLTMEVDVGKCVNSGCVAILMRLINSWRFNFRNVLLHGLYLYIQGFKIVV